MWGFLALILIIALIGGLIEVIKELRLRGVLIVSLCIFLYWGLFQLPDILPLWALYIVTGIIGAGFISLVLISGYLLIKEIPGFIKRIW